MERAKPIMDLVHDEYRARLYRHGPRDHKLYLQKADATRRVWKNEEHELKFGRCNAMTAARAYFELWRIKEGGA